MDFMYIIHVSLFQFPFEINPPLIFIQQHQPLFLDKYLNFLSIILSRALSIYKWSTSLYEFENDGLVFFSLFEAFLKITKKTNVFLGINVRQKIQFCQITSYNKGWNCLKSLSICHYFNNSDISCKYVWIDFDFKQS